jgi:hypothetical protein
MVIRPIWLPGFLRTSVPSTAVCRTEARRNWAAPTTRPPSMLALDALVFEMSH